MYKEEELDNIVNLVSNGVSLEEAKLLVLDKRLEYPSNVKSIADSVCKYFNRKDLIARSRRPLDLAPTAIFMYLVADILEYPRDTKIHKYVSLLTARDRTTFIYYISRIESGIHLHDKRYIMDDYVINHFHKLKQIITGDDFSHLLIKKKSEVISSKKYDQAFDRYKDSILDSIEKGANIVYLNKRFFKFKNQETLKNIMSLKDHELYESVKKDAVTKYKRAIIEYLPSIKEKARLGYSLKEINDLYFSFDSVAKLRIALTKHNPEIAESILINYKRK